MKKILITGSGGLIGSTAVNYYLEKGYKVIGIDNNMRAFFFTEEASVVETIDAHKKHENYEHNFIDIKNKPLIEKLFLKHSDDLCAVIHTAAQPSHDWAARNPVLDFEVNALGTLNLLEATREYCPDIPFIFTSTNKVYGDRPNKLRLIENDLRYDFEDFELGIDETLSIDQSLHSVFGASKVAADVMVQEYGKYFNMKTVCFRGGCLTGPQHKSVELHGFLSYIVRCAMIGRPYKLFGYKGKQVRDQIHSSDCISAFDAFIEHPRCGEVYNLGGEKENSASILEVIEILKNDFGLKLQHEYYDQARIGDHMCYYTNMSKFRLHYPSWEKKFDLKMIIQEMIK